MNEQFQQFVKDLGGHNTVKDDFWDFLIDLRDKSSWDESICKVVEFMIKDGFGYAFSNFFKEHSEFQKIKIKLKNKHHLFEKPKSIRKLQKELFKTGKLKDGHNLQTREVKNYEEACILERYKCQSCNKEEDVGLIMKVCAACKKVRYCSKSCQKQDWKNHKINCNV